MADLSLSEMIYYHLEYASEGMSLEQLQAELKSQFDWDGTVAKLEQELKARSEFCCKEDRWLVNEED